MPFDGRSFREPEVKTDFTREEFLAWAKNKPARQRYDYVSHGHCAVAQFLKETNRCSTPYVIPRRWGSSMCGIANHPFPNGIEEAVHGDREKYKGQFFGLIGNLRGSTFGKLVKRLEANYY